MNYQNIAVVTGLCSIPIMTGVGIVNAHRRCKSGPLAIYVIEVWLGAGAGAFLGFMSGIAWPVFWSTPILYLTKKLNI